MSDRKKGITRRDFVRKAGAIGAMGFGLASLEGFARLSDAIARRAGPRPRGGPGPVRPLDWSCPTQYCQDEDEYTCGSGQHDCQMGYVNCEGVVTCAHPAPEGFECFGPDAYGCVDDRDFVCEVHFLCKGTDGGRFNCGGQKHLFDCQLQFACSPPAVYCEVPHWGPVPPEPTAWHPANSEPPRAAVPRGVRAS